MLKGESCDDEDPDDHVDIELIEPNNLVKEPTFCTCNKTCPDRKGKWGNKAIHIDNGNDNLYLTNENKKLSCAQRLELDQDIFFYSIKAIFVVDENGGFVTQNQNQLHSQEIVTIVARKFQR